MLNNPNEWHNIEEDLENNGNASIAIDGDAKNPDFVANNMPKIKLGLFVVGIVLIVVIVIAKAVGAKKTELAYNNPMPSTTINADVTGGNEPTAVIDVDLGDGTDVVTPAVAQDSSAVPIAAAPISASDNSGVGIVIASKEMTPTDKYNFNKKALEKGSSKGTVIVSIGGGGRPNPFFPFKEKKNTGVRYPGEGNVGFDIIEPPPSVIPDPKATQMMETTISGIMYDTRNPSAIININGTDQLVRRSDKVNGYTILDITKDKVVIKSGSNIYRASVGQTLSDDELTFNDIANLRQKFGGSYRPVAKNNIDFNAN